MNAAPVSFSRASSLLQNALTERHYGLGRVFAVCDIFSSRRFPTSLSGCPSERVPLTFVSRCQFSDRDCKPAETSPVSHKRLYNCGAFSWSPFMAAVCGRPSGLPRLAGDSRSCRPAHSCHPSSASDAGSSYFTPEVYHDQRQSKSPI